MRCALIEYNCYHDITFPTLVYLLQQLNINVDIYTSQRNIQRNPLVYTSFFKEPRIRRSEGRLFDWRERFEKYRTYDFVIVNSIEPKKWLARAEQIKCPVLAILHNARLYNTDEEYQKFFTDKKRKLIVLSKHITQYLKNTIESYWIAPVYLTENYFDENKPETTFCVQGSIQYNRRNYPALLEAIERFYAGTNHKIKIKLVGGIISPANQQFEQDIRQKNIVSFFEIVKDDVSYEIFLKTLGTSDFLLPLLDNTSPEYQKYVLDKMTTSIPISIGLNVIPIVHQQFAEVYEIKQVSICYENGGLYEAMRTALRMGTEEKYQKKKSLHELRQRLLEQSVQNIKMAIESL